MATKPKKNARYDLKAADRRRNLVIQIGLTTVVVVFAVALVLYIVMSAKDKPGSGDARAIRVASSKVANKEGTTEPKAVLQLNEDFLCPACGDFERKFGPTVSKLIDTGAIAADYHMVAILDASGDGYSSRAGSAAYCVADESIDSFRRFHSALYAPGIQPEEGSGTYPDNKRLTELARQAGAGGDVPGCISSGRYVDMVKGMAAALNIHSTPTVRINGEDYEYSTPDALVSKIKEIVGNVPGLDGPAPAATAPAAPALPGQGHLPAPPAPAPAAPAPPAPAPAPVPTP